METNKEYEKIIEQARENNDKSWLIPLEIAKALNVNIISLIDELRWSPVLNPDKIKENEELIKRIRPIIKEIYLRANTLKTLLLD